MKNRYWNGKIFISKPRTTENNKKSNVSKNSKFVCDFLQNELIRCTVYKKYNQNQCCKVNVKRKIQNLFFRSFILHLPFNKLFGLYFPPFMNRYYPNLTYLHVRFVEISTGQRYRSITKSWALIYCPTVRKHLDIRKYRKTLLVPESFLSCNKSGRYCMEEKKNCLKTPDQITCAVYLQIILFRMHGRNTATEKELILFHQDVL